MTSDSGTKTSSLGAPSASTCPLCHTPAAGGSETVSGSWRCGICGQSWTALRLETVAEYAVWASGYDRSR